MSNVVSLDWARTLRASPQPEPATAFHLQESAWWLLVERIVSLAYATPLDPLDIRTAVQRALIDLSTAAGMTDETIKRDLALALLAGQ